MVRRLSLSFSMVLEAMIPGIPQPDAIRSGMKLFTGKSEVTEHTVHDECDTYHVSAVLKDGKH